MLSKRIKNLLSKLQPGELSALSGMTIMELMVVLGILSFIVYGLAHLTDFALLSGNEIDKQARIEGVQFDFRYKMDCAKTLSSMPSPCINVDFIPKDNLGNQLFLTLPKGISKIVTTCGELNNKMVFSVQLTEEEKDGKFRQLFKEVPFGC